jgi:hypothetical protein
LKLLKQILFPLLSIAVGVVFIYGAYAKMVDIEPFEWTMAETGLLSFGVSNIVARLFIILEFALGALIIASFSLPQLGKDGKLRHYTYIISMWLVGLFNLYLLYILFAYGNNGNCGCFGNMLQMSPLAALVKNMGILIALDLLHRWWPQFKWAYSPWPYMIILVAMITRVFLYTPPDFIFLKEKQLISEPYKLDLSGLYRNDGTVSLPYDSTKDKFLLVVVSTHCQFCDKAARRLRSMKEKHENLAVFMVTKSDSVSYKAFIKKNIANNIPFQLHDSVQYLNTLVAKEKGLPVLLWVDKGMAVKRSNYYNLNEQELVAWSKSNY